MADIFHEVEEDLRRERLDKLWSRYGTLFVIIAVLAVAATAAVVFWRRYEANQIAAASDTYLTANARLAGGDVEGALTAYGEIAADSHNGYAILAQFRQAWALAGKNDIQGALAAYDRILNSSADAQMKDVARLNAAYAVMDIEAPDVLKNRVAPLVADGNPFRYQAREIQAYADYRAKAPGAAAAYAAIAADTAAPPALRDRAEKIAAFLNGGAEVSVAPIPPAVPAEAPPATPPADAPTNP